MDTDWQPIAEQNRLTRKVNAFAGVGIKGQRRREGGKGKGPVISNQ